MNNQDKEFILEVTQEEYDAAMARGWNDDDIQKPGKYRYRRATRFAKPEDLHPSNTTVHVSLPVTLDVFQHFEKRVKELNADSIEELMLAELRAATERDRQAEQTATERLLANPEFIRAVAAQLAEIQAADKQSETDKQTEDEPELQAA